MVKVYLSGPIKGVSYAGATEWREYAADFLMQRGVEAYSPMRAKQYLAGAGPLRAEYPEHPLSTAAGITTRDRWDCERCDVMLCYVLGAVAVSVGTVMELGWADAARRPIVLVMEPSGNPHDHSMVRSVAGFVIADLDDALNVVVALARP